MLFLGKVQYFCSKNKSLFSQFEQLNANQTNHPSLIMTEFQTYLQLGFTHIADPRAYDHILFVVSLCAIYRLRDWKRVLILVTAFTIGHSLTLALATLRLFEYSSSLIEFLIPLSIILTCVVNFFHKSQELIARRERSSWMRYAMALLFGLIHGLGFSNFLRSMLGRESSIWQPLLSFNIGLELGQILIVFVTLLISFMALEIFKRKKHDWNLILSAIILGISLTLFVKAEYWEELGISIL
jgi:uncharacterized membrane protein YczE